MRITKALIGLHGCAGWSAPVLFASPLRQVFSRRGPNYYHLKYAPQVSCMGCCTWKSKKKSARTPYRHRFCNCRIRVENALKTQVICTVFSTQFQIANPRSSLIIRWTAVKGIYLSTNRSSWFINANQRLSLRSNADPHCNALLHSHPLEEG